MGVECDDLLRVFIDFLRDPEIGRSSWRVVGRMRFALMLGERQQRRIPTVGSESRRIIDRQAEIISDFWAGYALRLILVKARRPFTRGIDLREGRNTESYDDKCGKEPESHQAHSCYCSNLSLW